MTRTFAQSALKQQMQAEIERLKADFNDVNEVRQHLKDEVLRLRQAVRSLVEVYAPHERKEVLLKEFLNG